MNLYLHVAVVAQSAIRLVSIRVLQFQKIYITSVTCKFTVTLDFFTSMQVSFGEMIGCDNEEVCLY